MFDNILFDLDGTLTDPAEGITNSVAYALKKMGITPPERTELLKFIGPPLADSFEKYYNLTTEQSYKAVDYYREYFSPKGIFENKIIKDADVLVKKLKQNGKKVILATSKPTIFAEKILKYFNMDEYFDLVVGSNLDGSLTDKAEVISVALKSANITELSKTVMIGDRSHDIIGALKNGVIPIGVTFGYGSEKELTTANAKYIFNSIKDLSDFLLQK